MSHFDPNSVFFLRFQKLDATRSHVFCSALIRSALESSDPHGSNGGSNFGLSSYGALESVWHPISENQAKKLYLPQKSQKSGKSGRRAKGSLTSVALFSGAYLFVNLEADVRRSVFYSAANGNAIEFGERSEVLSPGERIEIENTAQGMGDET